MSDLDFGRQRRSADDAGATANHWCQQAFAAGGDGRWRPHGMGHMDSPHGMGIGNEGGVAHTIERFVFFGMFPEGLIVFQFLGEIGLLKKLGVFLLEIYCPSSPLHSVS